MLELQLIKQIQAPKLIQPNLQRVFSKFIQRYLKKLEQKSNQGFNERNIKIPGSR